MKSQKVLFVGLAIASALIIGITTWSPWLSDAETEKIVRENPVFIDNNDNLGIPIEEVEVHIFYAPLIGRWVTTVEGGNFVGFWNGL